MGLTDTLGDYGSSTSSEDQVSDRDASPKSQDYAAGKTDTQLLSGSDSDAEAPMHSRSKREGPLPSAAAAFESVQQSGLTHKVAADAHAAEQARVRMLAAEVARSKPQTDRKASDDSDEEIVYPGGQPTIAEASVAYQDFVAEAGICFRGPQPEFCRLAEFNSMNDARKAELSQAVAKFAAGSMQMLTFPETLSSFERKFVHFQADEHGLFHESVGRGSQRRIQVFRRGPKRTRTGT